MAENGFLKQAQGFATLAIHAGQDPGKWKSSAVVAPIFTSTTFKQTAPAEHNGFEYGRSGNPTRNTLEECLAALDDGKYALTFASGLGTTTTIASLLSRGDHIISGDDVYGGTNRLFRQVVQRMGIEISFIDFTNIDLLTKSIQKNTKLIWLETPTNPLMKIADIAAVSKIAKSHGDIIVAVDNTFLTPYLQKPLNHGADIVVYSLTKYMNGHSDVIMGAAVVNDKDLEERLRFLQNAMGIVPSPMDCYLVNRSLKTLALRMEQHKNSSLVVANWLLKHPKVTEVMHPGGGVVHKGLIDERGRDCDLRDEVADGLRIICLFLRNVPSGDVTVYDRGFGPMPVIVPGTHLLFGLCLKYTSSPCDKFVKFLLC